MRLVILTDLPFVLRESAMLHRLEVGLAGEGVTVDVAAPDTSAADAIETLYARVHSYPTQRVIKPLPDLRAGRLMSLLSSPDERGADRPPVDVVHVFGEEAWPLARRLARQLECALAIEVWRIGLAHRAVQLVAGLEAPDRAVLLAPDPAIAEALSHESPQCPVRTAPWGVHSGGQTRAPVRKDRDTPVIVVAEGDDRQACGLAYEGLCSVAARRPVMIVTDDGLATRCDAWTTARTAGALERFTVVPSLEAQRQLLTTGGVLALPEPRGEHRSIVLDAMAAGMPVIGRPDAAVSYLQPDRTMRALMRGTSEEWATALSELLDRPDRARELGAAAHDVVAAGHKASTYVSSVLDAYEQLTAPNPIPLHPVP